jgi:hypothetical protein
MSKSGAKDGTVVDYTWITGGERGILHVKRLGAGLSGEVHKVSPPFFSQLTVHLDAQ